MFINLQNSGFNNHTILQKKYLPSDHVLLYAGIQIDPSNIDIVRRGIKKGSEEEIKFDSFILNKFSNLNSDLLTSRDDIKTLMNCISCVFDEAWLKFSRESTITKHSKEWWNKECSNSLVKYHTSRSLEDWKPYKNTICYSKNAFFEEKIHKIAITNKRSWDLMNWVKCKPLSATEAIKFNNLPCTSLDMLWQALYSTYNSVTN